jgi:hypothetical protein
MITCKTCYVEKPLECYTPSQQNPKGRCKECQSEYGRKHYEKNRETYLSKDDARREGYRKLIAEYKDVPCKDCGVKYPPYIMDFDHLNPDEKSFTIGRAVAKGLNKEIVIQEIKKCDVVCSNCHRQRTYSKAKRGRQIRG